MEASTVPSLHSWWAAEFFYDHLIIRWGKLKFVHKNNGSEYDRSFIRLCKALGIIYWKTSLKNSKNNSQAKHVIQVMKECIRWGLLSER